MSLVLGTKEFIVIVISMLAVYIINKIKPESITAMTWEIIKSVKDSGYKEFLSVLGKIIKKFF